MRSGPPGNPPTSTSPRGRRGARDQRARCAPDAEWPADVLAPGVQRARGRPEHERRSFDLAPGGAIATVCCVVEGCGGSILVADGVDGRWIAQRVDVQAANVVREGAGLDPQPSIAALTNASGAAVISRSGSGSGWASNDHGQYPRASRRPPGQAPHSSVRIEDHQMIDSLVVVERESIRHPAATVMTRERESLEAEAFHQRHHVSCHRRLRVRGMVRRARWRPACAVATKIRADHGELLSELGSDPGATSHVFAESYEAAAEVRPCHPIGRRLLWGLRQSRRSQSPRTWRSPQFDRATLLDGNLTPSPARRDRQGQGAPAPESPLRARGGLRRPATGQRHRPPYRAVQVCHSAP